MKKLITWIIAVSMIVFLSSCGASHYYSRARLFKPDRHNKVSQCRTYDDMNKRR